MPDTPTRPPSGRPRLRLVTPAPDVADVEPANPAPAPLRLVDTAAQAADNPGPSPLWPGPDRVPAPSDPAQLDLFGVAHPATPPPLTIWGRPRR